VLQRRECQPGGIAPARRLSGFREPAERLHRGVQARRPRMAAIEPHTIPAAAASGKQRAWRCADPARAPAPRGNGRGGGGGGDRSAQLARSALMKRATPPSIPSPSDTIQPPASPPAIVATGVETIPGAPTPIESIGTAAGRGDEPGGGDGRGGGNGPGDGTGLDAGKVAGTGGDVYLPGNGVSNPVLVREVKPNYTADAMRAKIQGTVEMEAVVRADGTIDPRSIRFVRSLDSTFGLDREAIEAVKQWRFSPALRKGHAVAPS